ncbi:type VI secretion system baseplate subunit TssK [Pseudomonas putida]|uniref:type VI secretion system baseplate subunit TssK n=1 Tax=Pseudomonas putida TaxID=303 RepID=UPI002363A96E|nr:type VI secretion system baseplate subunit TssK [Pseudomonas putida]MDD1969116.1 type VI secretion system baseplate subunit TssK [Pseudomonas putida]
MSNPAKILWGEGLFLRPQLFQQQDAYHEARLREVNHALHPYAWGIRKIQLDVPSLANGILRIVEVSAIFPDCEIYSAPYLCELPVALDLNNLPTSVGDVTIYLALPRLKPYGSNLSAVQNTGSPGRYQQKNSLTPDLFTEAAQGEVAYLLPTVSLLTDDQPREAFSCIPLTRLCRSSTGGFEVDGAFLAPSLAIAASPALVLELRRMLESLMAKAKALQDSHREPSKNIVEFRAGDIASFWLLHTTNTACASLMHLLHHPQLHPERLYQELLRLAGALMTFSKSHELSDLPAYEHANPGPAFTSVFTTVRALIDTVISARYFNIPLTQVKSAYHQGRIDAQRIDENASLYLAVKADLSGAELSEIVPRTFKVGAPDVVEQLVAASMPGVTLTYTPQVPAAIPIRPGMLYFAVEPRGETYEQMRKTQTVMIFVPNGLSELKLELIALTT